MTQQYETNVSNNKKKRTLHHIGFAVYEVPPNMTRLTPQYVLEHVSQYVFYVSDNNIVFLQKPLDVTNHSVAREVVTFFTLPPGKCLIIIISITFCISGEYIVMPQTNVPNCDGKFLLRILTDEQSNIW